MPAPAPRPNILPVYHVGYTGKGWAPGDWKRCGRQRNPAGTHYNDRTLTPPANTKISNNDYAGNFADFLEERPQGLPFCFWYGGHEPHRKYEPGEGIGHGKKLKDVDEVPPYRPREDVVRRDMLDYAYEIEWFDAQLRTPQYLYVRNFSPDRWPAGNPETNYTNCDSSPTKTRILELQEELERSGDPRIRGEGDVFETYEYIVDAPHSWAHYLKGDWRPQSY